MRWMNLVADGGYSWRSAACFDPMTMMGASMAMTAAGSAASAAGTIAGGNMAATAGQMQQAGLNFQAEQAREQEGSVIGASQRQMLDKQLQTRMLSSSLEARAAGGGVNAAVGSPLATEKQIASRGEYESLMDLFEGQNRATGLENEAKGLNYSGDVAAAGGEMQRQASRLSALGTIAGGAGSMLRTYGAFAYPNTYGRPGIGYG